ncbi:MAG TPA: type II CAAX endopeptidase family protein [Clostridia bacterium]|nr:type II CAAX endopeptidase family protein [Clostridia bacterium]
MKKGCWLLFGTAVLLLVIGANSLANFFGGYVYYLFYQGIYGIVLSTLLPVFYVFFVEKGGLNELGIRKITIRSVLVAVLFIAFSIGGQLYKKGFIISSSDYLIMISIPLVMTTFFEEFLFRGFFQIRFEKIFGTVPAVLLSGLMFSLYHLGYPKFRSWDSLLTLLLVGIMFALSFKLSGNSLFTAYFVNLPNAILTYLYNPHNFPDFNLCTAAVSAAVILLLIFFFVLAPGRLKQAEQRIPTAI